MSSSIVEGSAERFVIAVFLKKEIQFFSVFQKFGIGYFPEIEVFETSACGLHHGIKQNKMSNI